MARQTLGPKKTLRLQQQTGFPIFAVMVRGGTKHRRDLCMLTGHVVCLTRDGRMWIDDNKCRVRLLLTYTPNEREKEARHG